MFDSVDFECKLVVIKNACESILSNAELLEWTASKGLKVVAGLSPWVIDDFIELRDNPILHVVCQQPTAEAVGLSVDSRSNSKLEWTLDVSLTFNVPDFRAS